MKKHLGSTTAIVIGVLTFVSGVARPGSLLIAGPIIVVGAIAYRSAKKRNLGEVKNSLQRKCLELAVIAAILAAVLLQKDLANLITTYPVPNLIIPFWAIIAYLIIAFKKPKVAQEGSDMNKHD